MVDENAQDREIARLRQKATVLEQLLKVLESTANQRANKLEQLLEERKRSEEEARKSHEMIRLLLDSTGEAIYGLDVAGNCTFANSTCVRLLGYAQESDLLGKNIHDLAHHTRVDGTPYPVSECRIYCGFESGAGAHVDDELFRRRDGGSFQVEYWSRPIQQGETKLGAHALKGDQERCLAAGMDGYVTKPIRSADLFAAIEAAVAKVRQAPSESALVALSS